MLPGEIELARPWRRCSARIHWAWSSIPKTGGHGCARERLKRNCSSGLLVPEGTQESDRVQDAEVRTPLPNLPGDTFLAVECDSPVWLILSFD